LVAEDDTQLREALVELISSDETLEVVATAGDTGEAIARGRKVAVDVAVLDVKMPGGGGARAARELRKLHPGLPVVAYTAYQDRATVIEMLRAGAIAFIVKGSPPDAILRTIHLALRGESSLSVEVTAEVIGALTQQLQHAEQLSSELADLNRTKSDLLQVLSHELFTPITTIQGYAQTMAAHGADLSPEDARSLADGMTRATERLRRLVGNVRTAASLDRADAHVATVPTTIADLMIRVQAEFDSTLDRIALPSDSGLLELRVWAEPDVATRAIATVIENGLDFSPAGTPVEIDVREHARMVELSVADRGPGIPPSLRARIFEPFTQADPTDTRGHEGLGVGLFLARRVMQAHGGDIWAEDRVGGGTRVVLAFLPIGEASTEQRT
jgi:signal transduction histidine kinase